MIQFKLNYFILTIVLLVTEILIALFVHDAIIRPYIGDVLVVILIYCFLRSFFNIPVITTAIAVLIFSFTVETAQYFNIINLLGLQHSKLAKIIIGSSFSWMDLITYTIGIVIVLAVEKIFPERLSATQN